MGCDIHSVVQIRKSGKWVTVFKANDTRDYPLFGVLAGVQDQTVFPIAAPRGFPTDFTAPEKFHQYNEEGDAAYMGEHSYSWLRLSEIDQYLEDTDSSELRNESEFPGIYSLEGLQEILTMLAEQHNVRHEHLRMVFGFST